MPYSIDKKKCKQSDGDSGTHVLSYTDGEGKDHDNCHTSKKGAQGQIAAIEGDNLAETDDMVFGGGGFADDDEGEDDEGLEEALLREWIREKLLLTEVSLNYAQIKRKPYRWGIFLNKIKNGSTENPETKKPWNEFELEDGGTVTIPEQGNTALVAALEAQDEDLFKAAWRAGVETSEGTFTASGKIKKSAEFGGGSGRGETARARGLKYEGDLSTLLRNLGARVRAIDVPDPAGGDAGDDLQILFDGENRIAIEAKTDIAADFGSFTLLYAFPTETDSPGTWEASKTKHFTDREELLGPIADKLIAQMNAKDWALTLTEAQASNDYIIKKSGDKSYLRGFVTGSPPYQAFKNLFEGGRVRERVSSSVIQSYYGAVKGNAFIQVGGRGLFWLGTGMSSVEAVDVLKIPEFAASFSDPAEAVSYVVNFKDGRIRVEAKSKQINKSDVSLGDPENVASGEEELDPNSPRDRVIAGFALFAAGEPVTDETLTTAMETGEVEATESGEAEDLPQPTAPRLGRNPTTESLIRSYIREKLILEDLTGSDKSEIKRMIKKELEGPSNRREVDKAFKKNFDKDLKKALGVSFFGTPGKINKFVVDEIHDEVDKILGDKATKEMVVQICKDVIIKLYRELSFTYKPVIQRLKI